MLVELSPAKVSDRLGGTAELADVRAWVRELATVDVPEPVAGRQPDVVVQQLLDAGDSGSLPENDEPSRALDEADARALLRPGTHLAPLLRYLGLPEREIDEICAAATALTRYPELQWLQGRLRAWLEDERHRIGAGAALATDPRGEAPNQQMLHPIPERYGAAGRYFYVLLFVSQIPAMVRFNARYGVPAQVSLTTASDLRRGIDLFRRAQGVGGLHNPAWMLWHICGAMFTLGRLQYQPRRSPIDAAAASGPEIGEPILNIHIPDMSGSLAPQACADSLRAAEDFFPRHFPEVPYRYAVCRSWLLDEQLTEYLKPDSNIVRFQRMFTPVLHASVGVGSDVGGGDGLTPLDRAVLRFVYRRNDQVSVGDLLDDDRLELGRLPRRTTLEHAVVEHLRSGRHWTNRVGWLKLNEPDKITIPWKAAR